MDPNHARYHLRYTPDSNSYYNERYRACQEKPKRKGRPRAERDRLKKGENKNEKQSCTICCSIIS